VERWQKNNITIYHGDCQDILPELDTSNIELLLSDPPWGSNFNFNYERFSGGLRENRNYGEMIGDDSPFDPSPFLKFPKVILWGSNHFAKHLPIGTTLVWNKKRPNQTGKFLSDGELAWMKGGVGVYIFTHIWHGFDRESERGKTLHPTQKPILLMEWCLKRAKATGAVLDPFMGCCPVGLACINMGLPFIGIEQDEHHFETARQRTEQYVHQEKA